MPLTMVGVGESRPIIRIGGSVIKHTIHGDANITDDASSIRNLMNMNYDIRR